MARSSTIALAAALGLAVPGGAMAQEAATQDADTVGPEALRNFSISGERTTPPAPAEQSPAATPAPVVELPPVRVAPEAARPVPAREANQAAPAREEARIAQTEEAAADDQAPPAPAAAAPAEATRTLGRTEIPVIVSPELREPVAKAEPAAGSAIPWLYILAGGIGGLALLAFLLRRRREHEGEERLELTRALQPAADPIPAAPAAKAAPDPAPAAAPEQQPRPRIELEFKPGKAAATDAQASVEYELKIANVGDAEARRVRIEARLFNAQQDKEIGAFFSAPDPSLATLAPRAIPPQSGAIFKSVVALPKDQVREVVVQGRRLFIPMIAFNVIYEWGNGETGQTSMSYIVGRETEPPAEKMAPFRLDLGPRIYRSVGFRPSTLALTV